MKRSFKLENLDCAHCAAKMEAGINKLEGVTASINFMTARLTLEADDDIFNQSVDAAQKVILGIERYCRIVR